MGKVALENRLHFAFLIKIYLLFSCFIHLFTLFYAIICFPVLVQTLLKHRIIL